MVYNRCIEIIPWDIQTSQGRTVSCGRLDLTQLPHSGALKNSEAAIDQIPGPRDIIVDLDGPILKPRGFRIGLSVGELSGQENAFLERLHEDELNNVFIYSSRPLCGAYAQFLNMPGGVMGRVVNSLSLPEDQRETLLLNQLQEVGIFRGDILYPQGLEAVIFPLFKWTELVRLKLGKRMRLFEKLHQERSLVYLGDTQADKKIFQRLVQKIRASDLGGEVRNLFIQFHSSCPGGLF
ncbi:MAG: hypothetical protein UU73_C0005G0034 [Candidatus Daviesbacteria bacterium GW2011_GWA1_41_61]|uniref:Uncharacterized protein n=1 Tax=Candidatus Daviesbacteria bacterium GW2011_GWA2_40_9 TaxID=1618424 RepID=A0A0G0X7N8_9BACT|nr:MAG: hypothetical protein UU26_C0023G0012 [Candidatus Daviesbacteria bacterium GW2011_GWC1_40_9]KKR83637.1 MAG: hypothetical protein UU29_C0003G0039 [Candidatus Daviesbacteria bacterium GW2011_GWA2_40_9]KKR92704.1 MAG: hypothetical protein UU44_C0005G0034 [Candidatus Daviesbacteria bacterium GW2011_GWB1_41_15]KKS14635.1 MAG: hypothetical protein UU73_C0005G0034 [Candidatus Daviesbacteria bacterium GW2011_GWA1_41_61]